MTPGTGCPNSFATDPLALAAACCNTFGIFFTGGGAEFGVEWSFQIPVDGGSLAAGADFGSLCRLQGGVADSLVEPEAELALLVVAGRGSLP